MAHEQLAELAAVVGALGTAAVLLARSQALLAAGFGLLAVAEGGLLWARVPREDLDRLASPAAVAALVGAALAAAALAALLVRRPALAPVLLLLAAPFRIPVDLGAQSAFLLLPLYGVLAGAVLALLYRSVRGEPVDTVPRLLAVPAAAFVGFSAVSLLWSLDPRQGTVELLFFLLPFAALVAVVARAPVAPRLGTALAVSLVALASLFAAVGLWQAATHRVFFARDLEVANTYTSYFRVTSLFKDPSLYGRHLVLAIVAVLVALWLRRLHPGIAGLAIAFLFAGLWFSYSQSSMATLFAVTLLVTLVLARRRERVAVAAACVGVVLVAGAVVAAAVEGSPWRKATSGRSHLIEVTLPVIREHPLVGAGVGAQPLASRLEGDTETRTSRNASHTTPLTVAAELGLIGVVLYLALLAAAARLIAAAARRRRALGLGLGAVLLTLVVHSLVYAGFFQDPLVWGTLAVAAALTAAPAAAPSADAVAARAREPRSAPPVPAR